MRFIFVLGLILTICRCTNNSEEKVRIVLNKETVSCGDTLIARLYVKHDPSVAPEFHIVSNKDTFNLPPENLDYKNWIYKYIGRSEGIREFSGYVDYIDIKLRKTRSYFKIKFTVTN